MSYLGTYKGIDVYDCDYKQLTKGMTEGAHRMYAVHMPDGQVAMVYNGNKIGTLKDNGEVVQLKHKIPFVFYKDIFYEKEKEVKREVEKKKDVRREEEVKVKVKEKSLKDYGKPVDDFFKNLGEWQKKWTV